MKKFLGHVFVFFLALSLICIPSYAVDDTGYSMNAIATIDVNAEADNITVSEPMSYTEMVSHYATTTGLSYDEALKCFPVNVENAKSDRPATYRELTVTLKVAKDEYEPKIAFYVNTSESRYWAIKSIYHVTLLREYNGIVKQFNGELNFWLRGLYQIEYSINGDFHNYGTTTTSGGVNLDLGLNEIGSIKFSFSASDSNSFYKYFYEHETVVYQH